MPWDLVFFYVIGAAALITAIGMVVAPNPVHSAILLVLCFLSVAAIFVMLGAEFLAVIQVIVYSGAILVLVLFVLMLVDTEQLPTFYRAKPLQRYLSFLIGAVLLLEIGFAILTRTPNVHQGEATPEAVAAIGGNVQAIGQAIYTNYLLAFEMTSLVLTVGVIGAVVLALPERLGERPPARRGTISLGHPRGADEHYLLEGPEGETPIRFDPERPSAPSGLREVIMTDDPDAYTSIHDSSSRR